MTEKPSDTTDAGPGSKVIPLRKVQPGDLLDTARHLRRYMSMADTTGHTLYASFEEIDPQIQDAAEKARRHVEATARRLYELLALIERHPAFLAAKKDT